MPTVPNTMQASMPYLGLGGVTAYNVLHFLDIGGDFDGATVDSITDKWITEMQKLVSQDYAVDPGARFLDLSTDPPGELFGAGTGANGDNTSQAAPPNTAMVISLSAGADRRRRGRVFVPGFPSEFLDAAGGIDPTFQAGALDIFVDWVSDVATNDGWLLGVYSRLDGVTRGVQTVSIKGRVDTQRRRLSRIEEA